MIRNELFGGGVHSAGVGDPETTAERPRLSSIAAGIVFGTMAVSGEHGSAPPEFLTAKRAA
jgi:hypothetical protein